MLCSCSSRVRLSNKYTVMLLLIATHHLQLMPSQFGRTNEIQGT